MVRVACTPSLALSLACVARLTGGRLSQTEPPAMAASSSRRSVAPPAACCSQDEGQPAAIRRQYSGSGARYRLKSLQLGSAQSAMRPDDGRANRLRLPRQWTSNWRTPCEWSDATVTVPASCDQQEGTALNAWPNGNCKADAIASSRFPRSSVSLSRLCHVS